MEAGSSIKSAASSIALEIAGFVKFTFIGYFTIGLSLGVLPVFIHNQLGYSAMIAGVVISLQYLSTFLFRGYAGNIIDKKGPKPAVLSGMTGFAISGLVLCLAFLFKEHHDLCLVLVALTRLVTGFAEGLIGSSPINWTINAVGEQNTAKAISYNGIASYGGLAVGAPVGILLDGGYGIAGIGIVVFILGIIGYLLAKRKEDAVIKSTEQRKSFASVLKTVAPYGLCLTLAALGFGTISTFITLYYAYLNWTNAVLCLSVFSVFFILGRLIFAGAIDNYGGLKTAIACMALESVGLMVLWLANTPEAALIGAGVTGLGFSLVFPALGVEAVKLVPGSNKGAALGAYGLFLDISLGITGPLVGGVASHFGMLYIFPFSMGMVLLGFVLCLLIGWKIKGF
ncbi:MFS transporter [Mucilaginibacter sp. SMC90]|uniref:MFS transporter n=1 Tax=Mucilaginibacter sp. SMC90 TaxID=2929803 RepID=UPI001FB1F3F4|nr:MFS transporter [Mucilaginibacter sp. SMC90]UOE46309.1 MFS transporter [Mucilaginibacter sp. SMC90]